MSFIIDPYRYFTAAYKYLIDDYGAATGAWSLRLLNSNYTGALVRIRRSSDNAEKDFYPDSNNKISMSSDDGAGTSLSTWITTDSGYVTTWYGQETTGGTGSGNDATQSTAGNQPRIVNAGSLETEPNNGKVAMYFTSDSFSLGSNIATTQLFYMSWVMTRTASGTISTALGAVASTPYSTLWFSDNRVLSGYGTSTQHDTGQTQTGDFIITNLRDISNNVKMYYNTTAFTTKTYANSALNFTRIGYRGGNTNNGYMQELVYWNSDKESSRSNIESDTNDFWGVY